MSGFRSLFPDPVCHKGDCSSLSPGVRTRTGSTEGLPAHQIFIPDSLSRSGSGTFTALCDKGFCQPRAVLLLHQGSSTLSRGSCCTSFIISAVLCFGNFSVNASDGGNVKRRDFLLAKAQMSLAVWSQEMWQDHGPGRIMEMCVTGGKMVNLCVSYCCSQSLCSALTQTPFPNLKK